MPKATVNVGESETFQLKSLEGGEIVLKRMTYGQVVERRALMKLSVSSEGRGRQADFKGEMAMASKEIQMFEFRNCIVSHNLEKDDAGTLLNLAAPVDFDSLDPRVGQEIEQLISDMNDLGDDDTGN